MIRPRGIGPLGERLMIGGCLVGGMAGVPRHARVLIAPSRPTGRIQRIIDRPGPSSIVPPGEPAT